MRTEERCEDQDNSGGQYLDRHLSLNGSINPSIGLPRSDFRYERSRKPSRQPRIRKRLRR